MNHPPQKLRRLPELVLLAGTVLTRIHRAGYEPWRLSSDAYGRFNLEHPAGTCYLAFEPIALFSTLQGKQGRVISTEPLSEDLIDEAVVQFDLQVVPRRLP